MFLKKSGESCRGVGRGRGRSSTAGVSRVGIKEELAEQNLLFEGSKFSYHISHKSWISCGLPLFEANNKLKPGKFTRLIFTFLRLFVFLLVPGGRAGGEVHDFVIVRGYVGPAGFPKLLHSLHFLFCFHFYLNPLCLRYASRIFRLFDPSLRVKIPVNPFPRSFQKSCPCFVAIKSEMSFSFTPVSLPYSAIISL
jgi:hypothetical protein